MRKNITQFLKCYITLLITLASLTQVVAQNTPFLIKGKVVTIQNLAISNATVTSSSGASTVSDTSGNFSITVNKGVSLFISATGYKSRSVDIQTKNYLNVTLDPEQDGAYVNLGIGNQKKGNPNGSTALLNPQNVMAGINLGADQLMQGRLSGVSINQNSQEPSNASTVDIRGYNTIKGSNAPLYVLDGIPVTLTDYTGIRDQFNNGSNADPLSLMNPSDIESITVLKDAYSTAVYGSRGSNGVILITTKKGSKNAPVLQLNLVSGISQLQNETRLLNADQYMAYANEYALNKNIVVPFQTASAYGDFDHQKEITRLARTYDINGVLTGETNNSRIYVSGEYLVNEGIVINSKFERTNFRVNYDTKVGQKLTVSDNFNISHTNLLGTDNSLATFSALRWAPTSPLKNADGTYNIINDYQYNNPLFSPTTDPSKYDPNPLAVVDNYRNEENQYQLYENLGLRYNLSSNFNAYLRGGVQYTKVRYKSFRPTYLPVNGLNGRATTGNITNTDITSEGGINYNRTFKAHHFDGTLAVLTTKNINKYDELAVAGFVENVTSYYLLDAASTAYPPTNNYLDRTSLSYVARANYDFNNKYFLGISGSYDGTSIFSSQHKYNFYPAVAASWTLSNEDFFKKAISIFNQLKIKASYGISGNISGIPAYLSLQQLLPGTQTQNTNLNYIFGGTTPLVSYGIAPSRIAYQDIKPEKTATFDLGLDFTIASRIDVSVGYYSKNTDDLLLSYPTLPSSTGYSQPLLVNVGSMYNRGVELSANAALIKGAFNWSLAFNIAYNQNKVTNLGYNLTQDISLGTAGVSSAPYQKLIEGQSIGSFYGYIGNGIWNSANLGTKAATFMPGAQAGDRRYQDLNNDGVLDDRDRTTIGNALPKYVGGITSSLNYKDIQLDIWFSFKQGNQVLNQTKWYTESLNNGLNQSVAALNRWTINNQNTNVVKAGSQTNSNELYDGLLEDGSYLKCKNVTLSYTIPKNLTKKLNFNNLKIFASGSNLFTITRYKGFDPEDNSQPGIIRGVDSGLYPASRTFKLGLNLTF